MIIVLVLLVIEMAVTPLWFLLSTGYFRRAEQPKLPVARVLR